MDLTYCQTVDDLRNAYRAIRSAKTVSFDVETTGLDPRRDVILLAQFYTGDGPVWVINPNRVDRGPVASIMELLTDRLVLAHNATFEYQFVFMKYGVRLKRVYCSKLAEQVLTAGLGLGADLESTVGRRLNQPIDKTLQKSFIGVDPATFDPTAEQLQYAALDAFLLPELAKVQTERLRADDLLPTVELEFSVLPAFAEMELTGMRLNVEAHSGVLQQYKDDYAHYGNVAAGVLDPYWKEVSVRRFADVSAAYNSITGAIDAILQPYGGRITKTTPPDVRATVEQLRKERVKPKPTATIRLTSRDEVLAALAESGVGLPDLTAETVEANEGRSPVLAAYAAYAKAAKIVSTYGDSLVAKVDPMTGRICPHYNQVVSTGRTSSSDPNGQNMPKKIRACFEPDAGNRYVVADFANMELRIAAGLSNDPVMLQAFSDKLDLHCITASKAYPDKYPTWLDVPKDSDDRANSKTANFAVIYGSSSIDKAVMEGIKNAYPVLMTWLKQQQHTASTFYFAVTALGRKRFFKRLAQCPTHDYQAKREWHKQRAAIERQGGNHPVQGTGADIAKRAVRLIYERVVLTGLGRIVAMVHDEIVTECAADRADHVAKLVGESMREAGFWLIPNVEIPADVHIVDSWVK